ncbi:MAG: hypothetical protein ABI844_07850 [Saprospiraceae bacterium]
MLAKSIDQNLSDSYPDLILYEDSNHLKAIQNFLLRENEIEQIEVKLPIKILLNGNHGSGKSTLLNYLQNDSIDLKIESTNILKIETYFLNKKEKEELKLLNASFFDFGGQDYYHGMYKPFLSKGALYLKNSI